MRNTKRRLFQVVILANMVVVLSNTHVRGEAVIPINLQDQSDNLIGFVHSGVPSNDGLSGIAVLDYNNDGWLDFYITNGKGVPDGLMRNMGDGTFVNFAESSGIISTTGSSGVTAGDLDNDGDEDLIVLGESAAFAGFPSVPTIRILKNNFIETGTEMFSDATLGSGLGIPNVPGAVSQAVLGDIDNDGLVDLFVVAPASLTNFDAPLPSNHLFKNLGKLKFDDISAGSNVDYANAACVAGFTHYDADGRIDLITGDCNLADPPQSGTSFPTLIPGPLRLYTNNGDHSFTRRMDVNLPDPTTDDLGQGFWMAVSSGDINNDGRFDLFSSNLGTNVGQPHKLFTLKRNGKYRSIESRFNLAGLAPDFSWGSTFEDLNNDGWVDLFFAGNFPVAGPIINNPGYILTNNLQGDFSVKALDPSILTGKYSSGVASGDFNNDGYVDIVVSNAGFFNVFLPMPTFQVGTPTLLMNAGNEYNHWITIKLQGIKSNRSGIGALVKVITKRIRMTKEVSGGGGFMSRNSAWLTFGLGSNKKAKKVIVKWSSGIIDVFDNLKANQAITLLEGSGNFSTTVDDIFATCDGFDVFEMAPSVFEAPEFPGNLIVGTGRNDTIVGTNGPDLILGLNGHDVIRGKGGNDVICGGDDSDDMKGNEGKDVLYGDEGADSLNGGPGGDILFGGLGPDNMKGKRGADELYGEADNDVLRGNRGQDELFGGDGQDELFGGKNRDHLFGEDGDDDLFGMQGSNSLDGGNGHDFCKGGPGNNSIVNCE